MATISPDEARALAQSDAVEAASARPGSARPRASQPVAPRDFAAPRRFSTRRLEALRRALQPVLAQESKRLAARLRVPLELALAELGEADAARQAAELRPPLCVFSPKDPARGGTLAWTRAGAGAAVELALGGELRAEPRESALSAIEAALLAGLLAPSVRALAAACGSALELGPLRQDEEELELVRRESERADPQRLVLALAVDGLGEASVLRLSLAGVPLGEEPDDAPPAALPEHVARVEVELSARLGSLELPLADVLGLRPGDVLGLDVPRGAPVSICLEEEPCLEADWGTKDGRLALRIRPSATPRAPQSAPQSTPTGAPAASTPARATSTSPKPTRPVR